MKKMDSHTPKIEIVLEKGRAVLKPSGLWLARTTQTAAPLCEDILKKGLPSKLIIDLTAFTSFDTTGVWLLQRTLEALKKKRHQVTIQNESESFSMLSARFNLDKPLTTQKPKASSWLGNLLFSTGQESITFLFTLADLLAFLGQVVVCAFFVLLRPWRLRLTSIAAHIERFGINAIPIIVLMSIALGLVLAYQGEDQLRRFGAEIYTINLVSLSIVREVGILITAILVAGRTGSAITAQLGIMKVNQEVDALNTLGLNPMEVLIVPRILALILVMPCLAFVSDIAGILGGGIMVVSSMDVSPELYIYRIGEAITAGSFWVGIVKAPLFGAIIGVVSCFEGMRVKGNAESIGICTTRSVVEGIFLVTITDALLSIFFVKMGI